MGNGEAQLFLVRVWQQFAQFRASVRGVSEEEPHLFTDPAHLADYFALLARAAAPASSKASGGDDDERA